MVWTDLKERLQKFSDHLVDAQKANPRSGAINWPHSIDESSKIPSSKNAQNRYCILRRSDPLEFDPQKIEEFNRS